MNVPLSDTCYSPNLFCGHPLENVFHFLDVTIFGMNPANLMIDDQSWIHYAKTHETDSQKVQLFHHKVAEWFVSQVKGSHLDMQTLYRQYIQIRKDTLSVDLPPFHRPSVSSMWIDQMDLLKEDMSTAKKVFILATCYQTEDVRKVHQMFDGSGIFVDWLTIADTDMIYMSSSLLDSLLDPPVSMIEFFEEKQLTEWVTKKSHAYDFGICIGETGMLQFQSAPTDLYFLADVHHFFVRVLTSLYDQQGKVLVYQPKETSMIQYNRIIDDSMYNYHIQDQLIKAYGRQMASIPLLDAINVNPGYFYDLYRKNEKPRIQLNRTFESIESFAAFKRQWIREKLLENKIEYLTCGYDLTTLKSVDFSYTGKVESSRIVCDAIVVHEDKRLNVIYQNQLPLQSPRYLMEDEKPRVVTNFLFYTTPLLLQRENLLRVNRPKEQIPMKATHFDVLFQKGFTSGYQFPLYNKAALRMDEHRNLFLQRVQFSEGMLTINNQTFYVNTDVHQEVYVMTPMGGLPDESNTFAVGAHRLNIVIVKEDIVAIRYGDVLLPSIGVVVSMDPDGPLAKRLMADAVVDAQGYVDVTGWRYHLELLDMPQTELLIGGGLMLMDHGNMVYEESIELEGWNTPLSIQTQESDIQNLSIHPRTAIGLTYEGKLCVFVFSGRSQFSIGANYRHMCSIIKDMVPTIDKVMNVDGGASSFLAYVDKMGFVELNVPSATFDTCAGRVRNVYSMLDIEC